MLRSMFTAISSLTLHQSFMDVVADNLSNVNTYGFKSSRITFQDQFSQLIRFGAAPTGDLGGINPAQIGLGSRLGSITANFTQGMLQSTGRSTDLAIQGDGFFIYGKGEERYYSRDGAVEIDADGYLVNASTGMRLQGWMATSGSAGSIDTGLPIDDIQLPLGSTIARATTNVIMGGNLDSTSSSGSAGAYSATIGVYDSLGVLHSVTLTFEKVSDGEWSWTASGDGVVSGAGTITFDANGNLSSSTVTNSVRVTGSSGADDVIFDPDLSHLTQLATGSSVITKSQDGLEPGSLTSFYVSTKTGEIYGMYSNGMQQLIGQIALASFVNPAGLLREGQSMFKQGPNSGEPGIGAVNTGGRGEVVSGYLEASNVDLAQEFTNMILAQRGFQASSRVITTSDEMLQELVNIKR